MAGVHGIVLARGRCDWCRREISGGVRADTGRVRLRRHKARPRDLSWCAGGQSLALRLDELVWLEGYAPAYGACFPCPACGHEGPHGVVVDQALPGLVVECGGCYRLTSITMADLAEKEIEA